MPDDLVRRAIAKIGAIDYLELCYRGLERQETRLRHAQVPALDANGWEFGQEIIPDVWFALIALDSSRKALGLAIQTSSDHARQIKVISRGLLDDKAVGRARNVYEHLDRYFRGIGNLQKKEGERRDLHLPQVGVTRSASGVTGIRVAIGAEGVDLLAAIQTTRRALQQALELLQTEE